MPAVKDTLGNNTQEKNVGKKSNTNILILKVRIFMNIL